MSFFVVTQRKEYRLSLQYSLCVHLFILIKKKIKTIYCHCCYIHTCICVAAFAGCNMEECLKVGPWGGKGGNQWSFKANKGGITEIIIFHGGAIDSISLKCGDQDGVLQNSNKIGGNGGHRNDKVHIATACPHRINSVTTHNHAFF